MNKTPDEDMDLDLTEEDDLLDELEDRDTEQEEPRRGIPSAALRTLVAAYLIWVIQEIVAGILKGKILGHSVVLLGIACVALSAGVVWLLAPEVMKCWKKAHERESASKHGIESK